MYPKAEVLEEPNLIFGGREEDKDARIGLEYHGPFEYDGVSSPLPEIRIGIIGDRTCLDKVTHIIQMLQKPIISPESNKWLFPSFPGMSLESSFKCQLKISTNWQELILESDIQKLMDIPNTNQRINEATELYKKKIEIILSSDDHPHVIICSLPKVIEDYCGISEKTRGAKTVKKTALEKQLEEFREQNQKFLSDFGADVEIKTEIEKTYDFRNSLKGKIMSIKEAVPSQILKESTMDAIINYNPQDKKSFRQDPASFSWNISTALYYKANGKPWRLAKLRTDTCYIGVSFFYDKNSANANMQTSMAQVFTHTGEGLVLRGTDVYVDEVTREAHLSESQAKDLVLNALELYKSKAKQNPARVVIHKATLFSDAEIKGFSDGIGEIPKDFVTINKKKGIRFLRTGTYPVLRGTMIQLNEKESLLYTSGYTSRLRTYPGNSIPQPLLLTHLGDSAISEISEEILGLSKLDWNTTSFAGSEPITLKFSFRVGKIMSELPKELKPLNHYKFYM